MCAHIYTPYTGAERRINCEYLMLSLSAPITSSSLNRKENKIFQKQIKVQIEGYGEHSEVLSTLSEKKKNET